MSPRVSKPFSPLCAGESACICHQSECLPFTKFVIMKISVCWKNLCTKEKIVSGVFSFVLTLFDLYGFWSLFDLSLFDLYGLGTACCSVFLTAPSFVELSEFPISGISKC